MKAIFLSALAVVLLAAVDARAQASMAGEWVLTYDQNLNGVVEPVHKVNLSITGSGSTFTGHFVGKESHTTFKCNLYVARGVTLIQMTQSSSNFYRVYSGIKGSPTSFQG